MLSIVKGDIFKCEGDILVHQTNCQRAMGSGIADIIKKKYPIIYTEFLKTTDKYGKGSEKLLGVVDIVQVNGQNETYIANLYGQLFFGNSFKTKICYTKYHAVEKGLKEIEKFARENNISVKIPYKMSSNLAGGDWNKILGTITDIFENSPVKCIIYNNN